MKLKKIQILRHLEKFFIRKKVSRNSAHPKKCVTITKRRKLKKKIPELIIPKKYIAKLEKPNEKVSQSAKKPGRPETFVSKNRTELPLCLRFANHEVCLTIFLNHNKFVKIPSKFYIFWLFAQFITF